MPHTTTSALDYIPPPQRTLMSFRGESLEQLQDWARQWSLMFCEVQLYAPACCCMQLAAARMLLHL